MYLRQLKSTSRGRRVLVVLSVFCTMATVNPAPALSTGGNVDIALNLANLLRAARAVIGNNQTLINTKGKGDKGLSAKVVLRETFKIYRKRTGKDPRSSHPKSLNGRLIRAQIASIKEVMDENQATINAPGVGFKGFVPAVFARLVNERFKVKVGREAEIKVTAPPDLIRNRKARPDRWETEIIRTKLKASNWPRGRVYAKRAMKGDRRAFRVLVPEYYGKGCLSCHGAPKGEVDITGYPREGGKLGDLGGAISITLFN